MAVDIPGAEGGEGPGDEIVGDPSAGPDLYFDSFQISLGDNGATVILLLTDPQFAKRGYRSDRRVRVVGRMRMSPQTALQLAVGIQRTARAHTATQQALRAPAQPGKES